MKKVCSILLLIVLLLNSSLLIVLSIAVDGINNLSKSTIENIKEKLSLELSYNQLTNKVQNEIVLMGNIERDSNDDLLYENPVISFEMPSEVEKIIVNDVKVLYDDELKLGEYKVVQNEAGKQIVTISLVGKQTKYQTDGINKGTTIRVSANVILKQDIKTSDTKILMTCIDGKDSSKTAKCEETIKVVNSSELPTLSSITEEQEGTKVYANGLLIENKAILGGKVLKNDDVVYKDEIIRYEVKVTNTTENVINNIKVVANIPEYMTYVELYDGGFWSDEYKYIENNDIKEKVFEIESLSASEIQTCYYEVEVGEIDTRSLTEKTLEKYVEIRDEEEKDKDSLTSDELYNLRASIIKRIALEIKPTATDDEVKQVIEEIIYRAYTSGEKLIINSIKNSNLDYEEDTTSIVNVLINNDIINSNVLNLKIKTNELRVFINQKQDRVEKNKWDYNIEVNNKTKETQNVTVNVDIPETLNVESVESLYYDSNGEKKKVDYEIKDNKLIIKLSLEKFFSDSIRVEAKVGNIEETEEEKYKINFSASAQSERGDIYWSNLTMAEGGIEAVKITQTSETDGEKIKEYEEVTYNFDVENVGYILKELGEVSEVEFEDYLPKGMRITKIEYDDNDEQVILNDDSKTQVVVTPTHIKVSASEIEKMNEYDNSKVNIKMKVKVGETNKITIKAKVKKIDDDEKNEVVENYAIVKGDNIKTKQSNIVTNVIYKEKEKKEEIVVGPVNPTESTKKTESTKPTEPTKSTKPSESTENKETYNISGKAWVDENENGKCDSNEQVKEGLSVYLYNINEKTFEKDTTGQILLEKTDKNGKYSFNNIYEGKYYIIVEYDSNEYSITDYQKSDISDLTNCDFTSKEVKMFGKQENVAMTNIISLSKDEENIDIGLVQKKKFDLKIEQYVQKISLVDNKQTREINYNNKKLAKVEIHSKKLAETSIVIEYKILITNIGEIAGSVNEIIDEMPSKLEFHSELNKEWTKSVNYNLSNTNYRTTEIKPGEKIELTLTLSKVLNDDCIGTLKNTTKIGISENIKHIEDIDKENDVDSTEVIIGVATGIKSILKICGEILIGLVLVLLIFILIKKINKIPNKKIFLLITIVIFNICFCNFANALNIHTEKDQDGNWTSHKDESGNSWECVSPGVNQCSAGHSYSYSHSEVYKEWNKYPDFMTSDGAFQGDISLQAEVIITSQSTFILTVTCNDTTGAPGDIKINAEWTGGSGSMVIAAGGGAQSMDCSGAEFILGCTVTASKTCETEYTHYTQYQDIYVGTPEVHHGHSCTDCYYEDVVYYHCQHNEGSMCGAEDDVTYTAIEKVHVDPKCEAKAVQDMAGYHTESTPVPISHTWAADTFIPSEYFPKKLIINKIDFDTGEPLDGCVFSISPTTLGGVSQLNGNQEIDMVMAGTYTLTEIDAPYGYQYGIGKSVEVRIPGTADQTISVTWVNKKVTGNLKFKKIDEITGEPLAGVVFEVEGLLSGDKNGGLYTTDENGEVEIYDILLNRDETLTLTIREVYNPYYGYVTDDKAYGGEYTVTIVRQPSYETDGATGIFGENTFIFKNKLKYAKLSGYVWEDMLNGKDNTRNDLYDEPDVKIPGVKVILHDPVNDMQHILWTDENGAYQFGSRQYNGQYSSGMTSKDSDYSKDNILLERANEYWIEFEYNGVKYRNVKLDIEPLKTNVSRASEEVASGKPEEDSSVRQRFNEKFSTISSGTQIDNNGESTGVVIDANGNTNLDKISYNKNGDHQSQIDYGKNMTEANGNKEAYGENIYHITSTTKENYNFKDYVDSVRNTTGYTDEIKYVNLGLYSREQVDVAVDSDVARFVLNVNGYQHTYKYATLVNPDAQEEMDVKLKALKGKYYERQLHESTISYSATPEGQKENNEVPNLYADITYKIYLQNKSNSLIAKIKELTLDYDSDLYIISYNYENSKNIVETHDEKEITANKQGSGAVTLKEATIDLEKLEDLKIGAQERNVLEVRFRVYANTIAKILNNPNGIKFDFMAEVKTYSTYADNEENAFSRAEGLYAYASIDKNSAARNSQVEIYDDKEFGPDKFVTDTFENDTTIAPTFILSKGKQTELSGIVYEDSPLTENVEVKINDENSGKKNTIYERVGDGKYNNENVMANVLVEVLSVPMKNGEYDSEDARTLDKGQQAYNVAKLYQENKTTAGQESNVLARTYTNTKGEYKFEGLVAGDYVIKFTYGKNMKDVNDDGQEKENIKDGTAIYTNDGNTKLKDIEAREYKSTIITSSDIKKAMNINESDGKAHLNGDYAWFLRNEEIRYSDAVDDVEYRANLEKDGKIDYETLQGTKPYVYDKMEAYTPYFKLGIEEFNDNSSQDEDKKATLVTNENGTIDYEYTIDNIDFGLIERPIVDLKVDKNITNLKVSLGNGQVLINGDPSKDKLPYVRSGLDDFVPIEMDTEILHNATIEEEYTITITNNSELDYAIYGIWDTDTTEKIAKRRNYYYYGSTTAPTDEAVTTRINVLVDYLGSELVADEESMKDDKWKSQALEEITEYKTKVNGVDITTNLLSSEEISNKLKDGKYSIYTTDTYGDPNADLVTIGKSKSTKYIVSREIGTSAGEMTYTNDIEILQYSGYSQNKDRTENTYRRVKDTTPGNLVPGGTKAKEDDEDSVRTTITPPTGTIIARWLYITTAGAGLVLIAATIIFIRKRILV